MIARKVSRTKSESQRSLDSSGCLGCLVFTCVSLYARAFIFPFVFFHSFLTNDYVISRNDHASRAVDSVTLLYIELVA